MVSIMVNSKGGSMTLCFPDVCKTPAVPAPPVPVPYPNTTLITREPGQKYKVHTVSKGRVVKKHTGADLGSARTFVIADDGKVIGFPEPCDSTVASRLLVSGSLGAGAVANVVSPAADLRSVTAFRVTARSTRRMKIDTNPPELLAAIRAQRSDIPIPPDPAIATGVELERYLDHMDRKLTSIGDDAQLANIDLQNMLQKQQQTFQMLSNISKVLHETALAVIRKIG